MPAIPRKKAATPPISLALTLPAAPSEEEVSVKGRPMVVVTISVLVKYLETGSWKRFVEVMVVV